MDEQKQMLTASLNKAIHGPLKSWRVFLAASALLALSSSAEAGNALENAIGKAQPCQALKVKTGLLPSASINLKKLKSKSSPST